MHVTRIMEATRVNQVARIDQATRIEQATWIKWLGSVERHGSSKRLGSSWRFGWAGALDGAADRKICLCEHLPTFLNICELTSNGLGWAGALDGAGPQVRRPARGPLPPQADAGPGCARARAHGLCFVLNYLDEGGRERRERERKREGGERERGGGGEDACAQCTDTA